MEVEAAASQSTPTPGKTTTLIGAINELTEKVEEIRALVILHPEIKPANGTAPASQHKDEHSKKKKSNKKKKVKGKGGKSSSTP